MLEKFFCFQERNTNLRTEILAGATTYMTLCYIIFVQPAVLSVAGMDFGAVMTATCLASAVFTLLMGLMTNYPLAMAPAMGHNFYFAFTVCGSLAAGGLGYSWQSALGAVFLAGLTFTVLTVVGFREILLNMIPPSLKHAVAVGIGLLIALVGFEWSGLVVSSPGTYIALGDLSSPVVLLSIFGLLATAILMARRIKGAILIGMLLTTALGLILGMIKYQGLVSLPPSIAPTFAKFDLASVFTQMGFWTAVFIFFFLDLFDSVGSMVGVAQQAGLIDKEGKLPKARQALFADALATVGGATAGTSTLVTYIESAAGVAAGARTGFANVITAALLLLSLFFYPLIKMVGGGIEVKKGLLLYPVIAPALILVGSMMLKNVADIDWNDPTEAFPAFLAMVVMPFTFSITEGIAFAFMAYALLKIATGRWREVHWMIYLFAALFLFRYGFLKG
jgi:AGZA family xanthine/uracil permease-like MFS transporter